MYDKRYDRILSQGFLLANQGKLSKMYCTLHRIVSKSLVWQDPEGDISTYTGVSLLVRTDNEAASLSVQGVGLVICTVLYTQVGFVIHTGGGVSLSVFVSRPRYPYYQGCAVKFHQRGVLLWVL